MGRFEVGEGKRASKSPISKFASNARLRKCSFSSFAPLVLDVTCNYISPDSTIAVELRASDEEGKRKKAMSVMPPRIASWNSCPGIDDALFLSRN